MKPGSLKLESLVGTVPDVSLEVLIWRATTGSDFRDEVWHGIYHVADDLTDEQVELENEIECWLLTHWCGNSERRVYRDAKISAAEDWTVDFRVPAFSLFADADADYCEGLITSPPDVVIEFAGEGGVHPEKLDFYYSFGIQEIWAINFVSGITQVIASKKGSPQRLQDTAIEPVLSEATGIEIACCEGRPQLALRNQSLENESYRRLPK